MSSENSECCYFLREFLFSHTRFQKTHYLFDAFFAISTFILFGTSFTIILHSVIIENMFLVKGETIEIDLEFDY